MDLKDIQQKLKELRDRIQCEGRISEDAEAQLKKILSDTLSTASHELSDIQNRLAATVSFQTSNDNTTLTDDQKKRLSIIEKIGTGSQAVH